MKMIYVMLATGFEEIEALAFVDILRRANIKVMTVSTENTQTVTGSHGITVAADIKINELSEIGDGIVLPGGLPGTYNLRDNPKVTDMINDYNSKDKIIAAICAAPSVFGEMGLLKGKKATCYPSFENSLTEAQYSTNKVVVDGNIITSRGAGTAHDFALKFVEIIKGKDIANNLRSSMLYE